jgi:hypothetical protein
MRTTHRPCRVYLRLAPALAGELEAAAAERRQDIATFVRERLLDWAADRLANRAEQEIAA